MNARKTAATATFGSFLSATNSRYSYAFLAEKDQKKYLTFDKNDANILYEVGVLLFDDAGKYKTEEEYRNAVCRTYVENEDPSLQMDAEGNFDVMTVFDFNKCEISVMCPEIKMFKVISFDPLFEGLTMEFDPATRTITGYSPLFVPDN